MVDTEQICELLDGARGRWVASGGSSAIWLLQKLEREGNSQPISRSECDALLRSLIKAWPGILSVLDVTEERRVLAEKGLESVSGLIIACSETYAERSKRGRYLHEWHALARVLRNNLHNVSLLRELSQHGTQQIKQTPRIGTENLRSA